MAMHAYPAILEVDAEAGFSVYFPDLPGCASAGDSATEAALGAQEALALHLEGLQTEELPLPAASDLSEIAPEPGAPEAARLLVTAYVPETTPTDADRSHA